MAGALACVLVETTYLVLAPDAGDFVEVAPALRALMIEGGTVHLVHQSGTIGNELRALKKRHVLQAQPQPDEEVTTRQRIRAAFDRRTRHDADEVDEFGQLVRTDPRVAELAATAEVFVPIGGERVAEVTTATMTAHPHLRLMSLDELDLSYRRFTLGRLLSQVGDNPRRDLTEELTSDIRDAVRRVDSLSEEHGAHLIRVVAGLHAQGNQEAAWEIAVALRERGPQLSAHVSAEVAALTTAVELSASAATNEDIVSVVEDVLAAADDALDDEDIDAAAHRLHLALAVLFHRELHADVTASPLVDTPDAFLAPLRASRVHAALRHSVPATEREYDRRDGSGAVLVLPGSYGRFSRAVIELLGDRIDATVLDMSSRGHFMGMGAHEGTLRARLAQALGQPVTPDYELLEAMEASDVVFADWADRGAVWTSMQLPAGVRMVLRIHSMDALSPWIHVIDWSRISDVVFVSSHLRDIVLAQVGSDLGDTRVHVIPNIVDVDRFSGVTHGADTPRTLALVGWSQKVKDPLWALEVLGRLRRDDPTWRLALIGHDFSPGAVRSSHDYTEAFVGRLVEDDVAGGVDFIDFTDDLPGVLGSVDVILSSSLRESFGVGLVEGAAAGCVPVVRDWPMFRAHRGARTLFPPEWVVADVDAAVARIHAVSDREQWAQSSAQAREVVAERFDAEQVGQRYLDVLVGPER